MCHGKLEPYQSTWGVWEHTLHAHWNVRFGFYVHWSFITNLSSSTISVTFAKLRFCFSVAAELQLTAHTLLYFNLYYRQLWTWTETIISTPLCTFVWIYNFLVFVLLVHLVPGSNSDHDEEKLNIFLEESLSDGTVENGILATSPSKMLSLW